MRRLADADRIWQLMRGLGAEADQATRLYFTGGATAVLLGWQDRSLSIATEGQLACYHYDLYAQALAKIERGHHQDLQDVRAMLDRGLIEAQTVRRHFDEIEPLLYRYPAVHPPSFRQAVDATLAERFQD